MSAMKFNCIFSAPLKLQTHYIIEYVASNKKIITEDTKVKHTKITTIYKNNLNGNYIQQ